MNNFKEILPLVIIIAGAVSGIPTLNIKNARQGYPIGIGIGWANATGSITGDNGQVSSVAIASSDSTIVQGPNGQIGVISHGSGIGQSVGQVESEVPANGQPAQATIDLTGNGGGNSTSVVIGQNPQKVFAKLIGLLSARNSSGVN